VTVVTGGSIFQLTIVLFIMNTYLNLNNNVGAAPLHFNNFAALQQAQTKATQEQKPILMNTSAGAAALPVFDGGLRLGTRFVALGKGQTSIDLIDSNKDGAYDEVTIDGNTRKFDLANFAKNPMTADWHEQAKVPIPVESTTADEEESDPSIAQQNFMQMLQQMSQQ
jgi:hypothetical protein